MVSFILKCKSRKWERSFRGASVLRFSQTNALNFSLKCSFRSIKKVYILAMSTAMNFSTKSFKPRPPDKGSFPLDHFGECKEFKEKFMRCLRDNNFDNTLCRLQSKDYLECRMDKQLMAKEPLEKLGFKDLMDQVKEESQENP